LQPLIIEWQQEQRRWLNAAPCRALPSASSCTDTRAPLPPPTHTNTHTHRSASPGRLTAFEDDLFKGGEAGDAPLVAAVALGYAEGQRVVGVAFLDPGSRWVWLLQFWS